jgi:hypothetical protein
MIGRADRTLLIWVLGFTFLLVINGSHHHRVIVGNHPVYKEHPKAQPPRKHGPLLPGLLPTATEPNTDTATILLLMCTLIWAEEYISITVPAAGKYLLRFQQGFASMQMTT